MLKKFCSFIWQCPPLFAPLTMLLVICLFLGIKVTAQVVGFGTGTPVIGTLNSTPVDTNIAYCNIRKLQFALSGMTNSATMFTGSVYLSTSPNALNNALLLGQFTNFGGANFSTNFGAYATNPPLYIILVGGSGTNTTYVQAIYGP
jgi:hypothetical protein